MVLRNDDIMGIEGEDMEVTAWQWRVHTSKASGKDMLAVTYYGNLSDPPVTEYLAVLHEGYAGTKSMRQLYQYSMQAGIVEGGLNVSNLQDMAENMTNANPPATIEYRKDGKFFRILQRSWK
jgi:DNA repair protein RadD